MCDSQKNGKNNKYNKGDEDMATEALINNYTLNEREALKLINAPIKKVTNISAQHDFMLSKEERIIQARKILDSNR